MRATVTNVFLTITAGVTGVIALDSKINALDVPLTLFIILLGVFGAVNAAKNYERIQMHTERARGYRDALEELLPTTRIMGIKQDADLIHNANWPRLHKVRLFWLWIGIQIGVAVFGVVLTFIAIFLPVTK
jgi:hypothetical protein